MLTTCPKCGLSQPQDQYCAGCGIDMTAYRPPDKSMGQKLSENLFVQLALVLLVGFIAVLLITRNQKQSFWTRVQFLRGSTSTQVSQSSEANQFSTYSEIEQTSQSENEVTQIEDSKENLKETKAKIATQGPRTQIYYLEIPQTVLTKWLEEGILTRVETADEITIGYIPQFGTALEQYKAQIVILKQESFPFNLNQLYTTKWERESTRSNTLNARSLASNVPMPMAANGGQVAKKSSEIVTYATFDDDRNEALIGQLEVSLNPQTSFPAQFEMSPESSFFISGFEKTRTMGRASETVVVLKIDK
jgi:hypothetical protein